MRKIIPRFTRGAIVLADSSPGAFAHVRAPASPRRGVVLRFLQAVCFCVHAILGGASFAMGYVLAIQRCGAVNIPISAAISVSSGGERAYPVRPWSSRILLG